MAETMIGNPMRRYLHPRDSSSQVPYALVTGATGGMGEEWAYQLAKLGFNVIIQGRNRTKLEVVKEAILNKFHCRVKVVLLVTEATIYPNENLTQTLTKLISPKDVKLTVVINNLGVQSEGYPILEDQTSENMAEIIIANAIFPAEVARICLPELKACQPSLLVTVTSIGAYTPTPYLSPYCGTKGFDVAFSKSLWNEMRCEKQNVDVVCMVPGQVVSGMNEGPPGLMVPTSYDWVQSALASLRPGWFFTRPANVITPWWPHYIALSLGSIAPRFIGDSVARSMVSEMKRVYNEGRKAL
ncbi:hypothetical protein CBS101457_003422 [Exobasidium rhododendri]|nr:hypothetical protein CBS101457_003422 [Exobasidium rhododendri]